MRASVVVFEADGAGPILTSGVPKLKPLSELQAPHTQITTLENGLRIATQETYGQVRATPSEPGSRQPFLHVAYVKAPRCCQGF